MCGVLGFYGGAHTLFAAYAKFGPVVGCGDVVPSYQAVLSRFRRFSLVGSSSKLQLRTCEACGVVGRKTVTVGNETRGNALPYVDIMMIASCIKLGVTNALRDGVRLKLIQLLGKPGHINDDKSERTCYLPWLFLPQRTVTCVNVLRSRTYFPAPE